MSQATALIRRGIRNASFTAISNALIAHPTLSPEARIALIYLLSKPEDWALQIDDLRRTLGTGGKPCGRNKAYDVIRELKASAFVVAVEKSSTPGKGWFGSVTYYVFDEPHNDPEAFAHSKSGRLPSAQSSRQNIQESSSQSKSEPLTGNREPDLKPLPEKRYPENRDVTKERKKQKTESPLPPPSAAPKSVVGKQQHEGRFEKLWLQWPENERPSARGYVEKLFNKLAQEEQCAAVRFAAGFRSQRKATDTPALMIPYLRDRLYAGLINAPPLDADGCFVITPDRQEWSSWIAFHRRVSSASIADKVERSGRLYRRTQWPETDGAIELNGRGS